MPDQAQAAAGSSDQPRKTRVFISYSRKDGAFAEKLRLALVALVFEAYLDKEDILPGEPWRARLEGLILAADAVVFVISPDSIASELCQWEVGRTLELKKTLVPLVWRHIPNHEVPDGLAERNYVFFDAYQWSGMADEAAFQASLGKLRIALNIPEVLWVREHTRLVARAAEWDQGEPPRSEGKLLPSGDIAAVEAWARLKSAAAPGIPAVLVQYLRESLEKERRDAMRQRRIVGRGYVKPALQALEDGQSEHALRLAAAGIMLAKDLGFDPEVDTQLPGPAARAIFEKLTLAVLKAHLDAVWTAVFSRDGKRILTASSDHSARLWDAATGKQIAVLEGHTSVVRGAAFSPDGQRIITTSDDRSVLIWEAATGAQFATLEGHIDRVISAVSSADGQRIVTASYDHSARIWDAATGSEITALEGHTETVYSAAFSPDGRRIVTAILQGHTAVVNSAAFSPDGRRVVTASSDHTARLWDSETGKQIAVLQGHIHWVLSAAFSPDGQRIVTASADDSARLWDAATSQQIAALRGHADAVLSVAFSPDSRRIVTASDGNTARLWDAVTGQQIAALQGHTESVRRAAFSLDGKRIVTASFDRTARIWDAAMANELGVFQGHTEGVLTAAFSPDGKRVVTASLDDTARIWDAATSQQIAALQGHTDTVLSAAFSPDGRQIVTTSDDHCARLWDAVTGDELAALEGHTESVRSAAYSPDGKRIVTASFDKTARICDVATGSEITALKGHTDGAWSAAFSPDGNQILTASGDKGARIWDAATGNEIAVLGSNTRFVSDAAFSPDGQRIITASFDNTARIWDVSRSATIVRSLSIALCAALAQGIGWRTEAERTDLLMQGAEDDLFSVALKQLGRTTDDHEIVAAAAELGAPLHPNCYLSPTLFLITHDPPPRSRLANRRNHECTQGGARWHATRCSFNEACRT